MSHIFVQVPPVLMTMTHVSPTGAIHRPSASHYQREATNASVPWDVRESTVRKVMFRIISYVYGLNSLINLVL